MGVDVALFSDDPQHLVMIQHGHVGGKNVFRHDHPFFLQLDPVMLVALQHVDNPAADIFHICGSFPQVGVFHGPENLQIPLHHLVHRPAGATSLLDQLLNLAGKTAILQDHQVGVKNGGIPFGEQLADPLFHVDGLNGDLLQGQLEPLELLSFAAHLDHLDDLIAETVQDIDLAVTHTGGNRGAMQNT